MREEKRQFHIDGMTCVNCQNKIEKALRGTPGIRKASVNYRTGRASVAYDPEAIGWKDIRRIIGRLDYRVRTGSEPAGPDLTRVAAFLAVIVALYAVLEQFGLLTRLVPSQLADGGMGYGALFVVGLVTSVHCVAMCGGINLSQSLPRSEDAAPSAVRALRPALTYNAGRVISYTAVGFILGLVGMLLGGNGGGGISALAQGILKLIAGLLMVIMGINMLGLFPGLRRVQLPVPRRLRAWLDGRAGSARGPFVVGLLNGLMPCGPLQSMQIIALASGSPFTGALSMLVFSLGTAPLMLGLGSAVSLLGRRFARTVRTVGAVLVVVLGLAMLSQGGSLSGLITPERLLVLVIGLSLVGIAASVPYSKKQYRALGTGAAAAAVLAAFFALGSLSPAQPDEVSGTRLDGGVQYITSTLSARVYPAITVTEGVPVVWTIEAPPGSVTGCNYRMLLTDFDLVYDLDEGTNVIEFTPTGAGDHPYTCWMGMVRGNIYVVENS